MPILRNRLKGSIPLEAVGQPVRNMKLLTGFTPSEIRRQRRLTVARGNLSLTGFTLVEISIVVAILAAAGAAAVVSYSSLPSLNLEAEVRKVLSDIYWTRQRAVATNTGHTLRFDQAGKKYSIYKSTTDFTSPIKEVILGISLNLAQANLWVYSPRGNMYLNDGTAAINTIPFSNKQGKIKNIRVFAETGNVKLE